VHSITLKTKYVLAHDLEGIMFWELTGDTTQGGLIDAISNTIDNYEY
jgi:chitinase